MRLHSVLREENMSGFSKSYLDFVVEVANSLDTQHLDDIADQLRALRDRSGRLFILGVGGSAANASHAVNDFRKLARIEAYSPSDNVAELTARINDEGWDRSYADWLVASNITSKDALFVLSVGGGSVEKNVSMNLIKAVDLAKEKRSSVFGIVGRDGGYVAKEGNFVLTVQDPGGEFTTPITESFQAVIWHLLVSSPKLKVNPTKW